MPVKISSQLPAKKFLEDENIFVMTYERAQSQDVRPLKIAVLNLMPNKIATETQLLRLLGNTPLQVEVVFLHTNSYTSKNTPHSHLDAFYITIDEVLRTNKKFDGLIITGAPVEKMHFTDVAYWGELQRIFKWAKTNVYSTLYICWAAQAGLYYHYGINKQDVDKKVFGVFKHNVYNRGNPLVRGFDDGFLAPHSRHTEVPVEDITTNSNLTLLAASDEAGAYMCASKCLKHVFVFGHGEYDDISLHNEYIRDLNKGLEIQMPQNYYTDNDITKPIKLTWRAHSALLMANWLNYCVYQVTPYDIEKIGE